MKHIILGIFAQVNAGKTTLSEALLYETGELKTKGRVDRGSSFLDHFSLERSRGITIFSKQARFRTGELSVTLLDTPGHIDFSPEAERAMSVLDYAIVLVSASDGVQSHTQTLFKLLRRYRIPTLLFFNKMDLPGADRETLLSDARRQLSEHCAPLDDAESVALCDEAALEEFLTNGALRDETVADMIRREKLFPCLFGAAIRSDGVVELLHALRRLTIVPTYPADFSARVYKISHDAQGNRLTHWKVTGGVLRVRQAVGEEKISQIRLYSGAGFTQVEEVSAGEVCAVLGLNGLRAGDLVGKSDEPVAAQLTPVMTYRVELLDKTDPHTALLRLRQLEEEEPQLRITYEEHLQQIQVQIMGQVQIEILESLAAERFDMKIRLTQGRVAYRETIADTVEGVGHFEPLRHYAEVHLILSSLPPGSGLVFDTICSEDVLDRNWQRLILTHLREKAHLGVLVGAPITDMKITLAAGRAHLKHTEGGDFRQATYRAVRQGLMQAQSVLLEPFYRFHLTLPPSQLGRAIQDIRTMGGRFSTPTEADGMSVLNGYAPVSEMREYMKQVVSYTRGAGRLVCEVDGYEPCHNTQAVLEEISYDPEADTLNCADSVFCSHGAGVNVKWNEVFSHMHLESVLPIRDASSEVHLRPQPLDLDEKSLQAIMEREFGPDKTVLHRPPPAAVSREISVPPPKKEYLIVDGYNMIFAWEGLREQAQTDLSGARNRLLDLLSNFCGYRPCELVVVFDSYRVKGGVGSKERRDNLRVVYTQERQSADLYIESLVSEIGKNYRIRVATSDALIQLSALRSGVLRLSANELLRELEAADEKIAQYIRRLRDESTRTAIRENPLREQLMKGEFS